MATLLNNRFHTRTPTEREEPGLSAASKQVFLPTQRRFPKTGRGGIGRQVHTCPLSTVTVVSSPTKTPRTRHHTLGFNRCYRKRSLVSAERVNEEFRALETESNPFQAFPKAGGCSECHRCPLQPRSVGRRQVMVRPAQRRVLVTGRRGHSPGLADVPLVESGRPGPQLGRRHELLEAGRCTLGVERRPNRRIRGVGRARHGTERPLLLMLMSADGAAVAAVVSLVALVARGRRGGG